MSFNLNYEYAKSYHADLLRRAEQSRLAHRAGSARKQRRRSLRRLLPAAQGWLLTWPAKIVQRLANPSDPQRLSRPGDLICGECR
jgi:hypothetical protein